MNPALRVGITVSADVGGAVHAYLYANDYRDIPTVGPAFLFQGSAMSSLALLILIGGLMWLSLAAGAGAAGSLVVFSMSRTVGLFGFTETGWEPSPYAVLSVVAEGLAVVLVGVLVLARRSGSPKTGEAGEPIAQPAGERLA